MADGLKPGALGVDRFFFSSELAREKMWSRIHLIPLLQAEEDRDQIRRHWADKEREKELMGSEIRVYHSDRYVSVSVSSSLLWICRVVLRKRFCRWCLELNRSYTYIQLLGNAR